MLIYSSISKIDQWIEKAEYAIDLNRYDLAIELANEVLQLDPESSKAYLIIARANLMKENIAFAEQAAKEALRLEPYNSYSHAIYALILDEKGKKKEAQREFEIALSLDPFSSFYHRMYALFLLDKKKDKERALFHAQKALQLEPEKAINHTVYGRVQAKIKDYKKAEESFEEALRLDPDNFYVQYMYGFYWMADRNRPDKAYPYLREAVRLNPIKELVQKQYIHSLKSQNLFYFLLFSFIRPIDRFGRIGRVGFFLILGFIHDQAEKWQLGFFAELPMIIGYIFVFAYILFLIFDKILDFLIKKGWYKKGASMS